MGIGDRHLHRGAVLAGSVLGAVAVVGLIGSVWGQESSRSLLQTIRTLIISPDGTENSALSILHDPSVSGVSDPLQIPVGALRDGSVVYDDIDRSMAPPSTPIQCPIGQVVTSLSGGVATCAPVSTAALWQSDDAGIQSIYYGTPSTARVYVGTDITINITSFLNNQSLTQGLYADGDVVSTQEVRVDDGLRLIAPGVQLTSLTDPGRWSSPVIASTVTPHAVMAQTRPLVIGEREAVSFANTIIPPPAIGIATMTPAPGVDVGGDVIVDGRLYVMRHETTASDASDDVVAWLTTLSSGQHRWMATRPSPVVDTDGQSRIQIDTPQLAIGYAAGDSPAPDTRLDVDGRAYVWHESGDAPVYLDDLRHDSMTAGVIDPTSSIPEECVALSLDSQGHVVLVNLCAPSSTGTTYEWFASRRLLQTKPDNSSGPLGTLRGWEPEAIVVFPPNVGIDDFRSQSSGVSDEYPRIRCDSEVPLSADISDFSGLNCSVDVPFSSFFGSSSDPFVTKGIVVLSRSGSSLDGSAYIGDTVSNVTSTSTANETYRHYHYEFYPVDLSFGICQETPCGPLGGQIDSLVLTDIVIGPRLNDYPFASNGAGAGSPNPTDGESPGGYACIATPDNTCHDLEDCSQLSSPATVGYIRAVLCYDSSGTIVDESFCLNGGAPGLVVGDSTTGIGDGDGDGIPDRVVVCPL